MHLNMSAILAIFGDGKVQSGILKAARATVQTAKFYLPLFCHDGYKGRHRSYLDISKRISYKANAHQVFSSPLMELLFRTAHGYFSKVHKKPGGLLNTALQLKSPHINDFNAKRQKIFLKF